MRSQRTRCIAGAVVFALIPLACSNERKPTADAAKLRQIRGLKQKLVPLHKTLGKPQPGEWLDKHKEAGQTFDEYLRCDPVTPSGRRSVIVTVL